MDSLQILRELQELAKVLDEKQEEAEVLPEKKPEIKEGEPNNVDVWESEAEVLPENPEIKEGEPNHVEFFVDDWDSDKADELDPFDPYVCRRPEPGDVEYELGQALRMKPSKVENMTDCQIRARFYKVQGDMEEERLADLTPQQRRTEVEELCRQIGLLKGQVQSYLAKSSQQDTLQKNFQSTIDRLKALGERCAFLISPDYW